MRLYTALQRGVVDGAENNTPSFVSSRHFEVCKVFTEPPFESSDVLIISDTTWATLTETGAGGWKGGGGVEVSFNGAWLPESLRPWRLCGPEGVTVHEVDTAPFMATTSRFRDRYASGEVKTLVERIQSVERMKFRTYFVR